jgi:hypothetical protein
MKHLAYLILVFLNLSCLEDRIIKTDLDPSFEQFLLENNLDSDGKLNGSILESDIENIKKISIEYNYNIVSLKGLEKLRYLESLNLSSDKISDVSTLDLSNLLELKHLDINSTRIKSLILSKNYKLTKLYIDSENLESIFLPNNNNIEEFDFHTKQSINFSFRFFSKLKKVRCNAVIKDFDFSNCRDLIDISLFQPKNIDDIKVLLPNSKLDLKSLTLTNFKKLPIDPYDYQGLEKLSLYILTLENFEPNKFLNLLRLDLSGLMFEKLDVSGLNYLKSLLISNSKIKQIDLSNNIKLEFISLYNNDFSELIIGEKPNLTYLRLYEEKLKSINVANANRKLFLDVSGSKNLSSICKSKKQNSVSWIYSNTTQIKICD